MRRDTRATKAISEAVERVVNSRATSADFSADSRHVRRAFSVQLAPQRQQRQRRVPLRLCPLVLTRLVSKQWRHMRIGRIYEGAGITHAWPIETG